VGRKDGVLNIKRKLIAQIPLVLASVNFVREKETKENINPK
jgi:hypothetical protein